MENKTMTELDRSKRTTTYMLLMIISLIKPLLLAYVVKVSTGIIVPIGEPLIFFALWLLLF